MAHVKVYRFTKYDITTDESRLSRRMATLAAIAWANGSPIKDTAREADESELGREVAGMTDRDYWERVNGSGGFQRAVTR